MDENLKKFLSRQKPSKTSIETYLQEICKTYKVSKFNLLFSEFILKIIHSKCQLPSEAASDSAIGSKEKHEDKYI